MPLADKIMAWLEANPGLLQSVEEIGDVIQDADPAAIWLVCEQLRAQGKVKRHGSGTTANPFRFYVKP